MILFFLFFPCGCRCRYQQDAEKLKKWALSAREKYPEQRKGHFPSTLLKKGGRRK